MDKTSELVARLEQEAESWELQVCAGAVDPAAINRNEHATRRAALLREAARALSHAAADDAELLELAADFETCIPFLPPAGQRNIADRVAKLRAISHAAAVEGEPVGEVVGHEDPSYIGSLNRRLPVGAKLYTTPSPAPAAVYEDGPTWLFDGMRITHCSDGQLVITRSGKVEFIGAAPAAVSVLPCRDCGNPVDVWASDETAQCLGCHAQQMDSPAAVAGGDAEEDAYVIDALAHLLAEISVIVNGPEPAGTKWSYHDLPAKVRALAAQPAAGEAAPVKCPWDEGSPCMEPRPVGMVYPKLPDPRAFGYLDKSGVEWAAFHTGQMEHYGRLAYSDGWDAGYAVAAAQRPGAGEVDGTHTATPCHWVEDTDSGAWDTACGQKHQFTTGDATDNGHSFCPYCGGRLLSQPASGEASHGA